MSAMIDSKLQQLAEANCWEDNNHFTEDAINIEHKSQVTCPIETGTSVKEIALRSRSNGITQERLKQI